MYCKPPDDQYLKALDISGCISMLMTDRVRVLSEQTWNRSNAEPAYELIHFEHLKNVTTYTPDGGINTGIFAGFNLMQLNT